MMRALPVLGWLLAACGLSCSAPVAAETSVSGAITSNTEWSAEAGPYVITGAVVIRQGARLQIAAGVDVLMAPGSSLTVESGAVRAIGRLDSPVTVRSLKTREGTAAAGDWQSWTFAPGAVQSRLEHVRFEHGNGIEINGSSPELVHVDIRHQLGAAIRIDLSASPTGYGLSASDNGINGIVVPAGDILGSVRWGLRGIPYVLEAGTVSVGQTPRVLSIAPNRIERGQTTTVVVDGIRLAGVGSVALDASGVQATPFPGGTSSRVSLQVVAAADARLGPTALTLLVDAGELVIPAALTVVQAQPAITSISPSSVDTGTGVRLITVTGRNFAPESEVLVNSAVIPSQFVSATELRASLPNQSAAAVLPLQVRTPDTASPGQFLLSNTVNLTITQSVLPTMSFEPSPVAMPPDGQPRNILLRLSSAATSDHAISLSISDTSKATVSPASVTIPAGQTSTQLSVTPLAAGSVSLRAESATLGNAAAPVFITSDFVAASTAYAQMVGVNVEAEPEPSTGMDGTVQTTVGVNVGVALSSVSPRGWSIGTTRTFDIRGVAIPAGSQVEVMPADGIVVAPASVLEGGGLLRVEISAAANAQEGARRIRVRDPQGALLSFADPAQSIVWLGQGEPLIASVTPVQWLRGATIELVVRGENLASATLAVLPGHGVQFAPPSINAAGTELRSNVTVAGDAELGTRVVRVTTPTGSTADTPLPNNSVSVVAGTPVDLLAHSDLVGVRVGEPDDGGGSATQVPIVAAGVGVVAGTAITSVAPRVGVIGTSTEVVVRGFGLQAVTAVSIEPGSDLTLGTPAIDGGGTELRFTVDVDAGAALGLRRLRVNQGNEPLSFVSAEDETFLVSAPLPELDSSTPQVLTRGATHTMTLRGRNLLNVTGVRLEPGAGISVHGPFTGSGDAVAFPVTVAADAPPGARRIVVTTSAGESTETAQPGNTVHVAAEVGPTHSAIAAPLVGVNVAHDRTDSIDGTLVSHAVGVSVDVDAEPPAGVDGTLVARSVGAVVGSAVFAVDGDGWLQGSAETLRLTGVGLDAVQSIVIEPSQGVLFGPITVGQIDVPATGEGGAAPLQELTASVTVTSDAELGRRRLRVVTAGGDLVWADPAATQVGIGRLPTMTSISPIVMRRGEVVVVTVRGSDLAGVTAASVLPGQGVDVISAPQWSQDGLGELLRVSLRIRADAPVGAHVLRLRVPGGDTTSESTSANTFNVVSGP